MKLIFCLLLVVSQVSFGQIILKDSSFNKIQLPSYKNNLLQTPGKAFQVSPNSGSPVIMSPDNQHYDLIAIQSSANIYLMSPDNMSCVVPSLAKLEKMPNANPKYLQSNNPMPNGLHVAKQGSKNH